MTDTPATSEPPTLPVLIYNGAGVVAEQPVVQQAPPATITLPTSSRRRLVESLVLFIAAILFLRTVTVEPFGVPTGSMAPTFYGNHKAMACPRCGYPVRVGEPGNKRPEYPDVNCSNCGATGLAIATAADISGDRLLVDKNVFRLRSPRRWEVAVFICPSDKSKPYVKRIVALPSEKIQLIDGDVWIDGQLSRKTLAEARECRVPVFDGDFAPPGGWSRRWLADGTTPVLASATPLPYPAWLAVDGNNVSINAEGSTGPRLAAYWHVGTDSSTAEVIRDSFEYNGHTSPSHDYAVHDFLVDCEVEVQAGAGAVVLKLTDGADEATAELVVGGEFGESKLLLPGRGLVATANQKPLQPGKKYRVEMAFIDRRVSLAVDRHEYFSFDLPLAAKRPDVTNPFRLGAEGATITFRHIKLYRDIYYRPSDRHADHAPFQLGADEYFMLGDNSANSDDSRTWQIPGVPERNFLGKPFLLHQPSRPSHWDLAGRHVASQTVDWDRIRWLR
ncbi:MAG TPA: S26 family signal peptidase [Gemmataceae bacterium]|nr:S26 family signal peptidase [Gemmataceae bacterium]